MKLTAQEEYGLRCLIQVARRAPGPDAAPVPIRDVASAEGLSVDYAAKLLRVLRCGNLLVAERGAQGGFKLARSAESITLSEVLGVLDTPLYGGGDFCQAHSGRLDSCVHTRSCSLRVVWRAVESAMVKVLSRVNLADLLLDEAQVASRILQPMEQA
ncbi:MAG: Rrf2 family transcriptional regulator [Myxococcales bacterium]|nr:Rrf2 family transcriptional regulator [Myxococcales bacterium]